MSPARRCSRTACGRPAVNTLTYVYSDQTAVLGPLAIFAEPHAYDLCEGHSERLSAPRGWEVLRLANDTPRRGPSNDDLLALADAVREAGRPAPRAPLDPAPDRVQPAAPDATAGSGRGPDGAREKGRRGHLRMLTSE